MLCLAGYLVFSFSFVNDGLAGARKTVFGNIVSVSEDKKSGRIHIRIGKRNLPVSPRARAFESVRKLPLPFEAQVLIERNKQGKEYVVDIQPRYH